MNESEQLQDVKPVESGQVLRGCGCGLYKRIKEERELGALVGDKGTESRVETV